MPRVVPLSPDFFESEEYKKVPDVVIEAFNDLIKQKWDGEMAVVVRDTVVRQIMRTSSLNEQEIYARGYLNIEKLFEARGWSVMYNKPVGPERFDAYYTFKKKKTV